ncbi:MAG: protein arginine kinase [Clostridia bacterium]|nr:protein arginine kinase [Clostridia bacterium]
MGSWYCEQSNENPLVISTRIRLARNLSDIPFPSRMNEEQRKDLCHRVEKAVSESNSPFSKSLKFIDMKDVPENERFAMVERHVVSHGFVADNRTRALILSDDESISIMVGEEDHLRIQVLLPGLQLEKAYDIAEQLDTLLGDQLHFAFDDRLGFLTECPTNLGTGLRASVMLHLPVMESRGEIAALADSVGKIGFTVRGLYGEGTKAAASLYQISNQITLGISEKNALDNLKIITTQLVEKEQQEQKTLNRLQMEDLCMRAYGVLQNARMMSSEEMMKLLSRIQLGQRMGILNSPVSPIQLLVEGQPYMLMRRFGQMGADERDLYRANMIRDKFGS